MNMTIAGMSPSSPTTESFNLLPETNHSRSNTTYLDSVVWLNVTTDIPESEQHLLRVMDILNYVNYVVLPTFLFIGLTGNSLTIAIMLTKTYSRLSSRNILIALSLSDSVLLITQPLNKMFVQKMIGSDWRALTDVGCKTFFVIFKTSKMTSSWFVVFLCIERFIAVWFPLKAKIICTKRNTLIAIFAVYGLITLYTSIWSYSSQIVEGTCFNDVYDVTDPTEKKTFGALLITALAIYSIIPTLIMVTLTPLIIGKLLHRSKNLHRIMTLKKSRTKVDERVTAMLFGVVFAYIILILPVTSLHMTSYFHGVRVFGDNSLEFLIFRDVTQILEQFNYSINFLLYVMTSRNFRKSLLGLCGSKFGKVSDESSISRGSKNDHSQNGKMCHKNTTRSIRY